MELRFSIHHHALATMLNSYHAGFMMRENTYTYLRSIESYTNQHIEVNCLVSSFYDELFRRI
jgi:hypothetical protein